MAAQISAGRKPAAVHSARPNRIRASTTRAFMRAPAPNGRGFFSVLAGASSICADGRSLDAAELTFPAIYCRAPIVTAQLQDARFGSLWENVATDEMRARAAPIIAFFLALGQAMSVTGKRNAIDKWMLARYFVGVPICIFLTLRTIISLLTFTLAPITFYGGLVYGAVPLMAGTAVHFGRNGAAVLSG